MKAVIGVGAPSYTSGAHMWNGAAATLKPKPTTSSAMPMRKIEPCSTAGNAACAAMPAKIVVPVAP